MTDAKYLPGRALPQDAVASSGAYTSVLHETGVDGPEELDLLSSVDIPSWTRFVMDNIAFHQSSIEWNG
jgi:hypothetical protein